MICDPAALSDSAKCIQCGIPEGMELSVLIYLAATAAGIDPTNTKALMDNSKCIQCGIPEVMQLPVLIYLSCQAVP